MLIRIKAYLSSPRASVACFILAVAAKAGLLRILLAVGPDKYAHILMTRNFLQGHGFSVNEVSINDLSGSFYGAVNGWPPGYSVLLGAFMPFTGDRYMLACYLTDCFSTLLFFWFCRKLLLLIQFPVWVTNLFLVFQGCFIMDYMMFSPPSDFLSLTLLLASLYYILQTIHAPSFSVKIVIPLCFFLTAACFTRYQNIPFAGALAGLLIVIGLYQRKRNWLMSGVVASASILLLCGSFLLYQYFETGNAAYLASSKNGWFPENLLATEPFILNSIVNLNFYSTQLSLHTPIGYPVWDKLFHWAGLLSAGIFTAVAAYRVFKKRLLVHTTRDAFLVFGFAGYLVTIGLLFFLSLVKEKYVGVTMLEWTYVTEQRYFLFAVLFFQICLWWYLLVRPNKMATRPIRLLQFLFCLQLFIETFHGLYYIAKKASAGVTSFAALPFKREESAAVIHFILNSQKTDPGRVIVVTSFSKKYEFIAGMYGGAGYYTPIVLNETLPRSSKPAVLLLHISKKHLSLLDPFLKKEGVVLLQESKEFCLYTYYVEPSTGNSP